jgi:hypothetical protein
MDFITQGNLRKLVAAGTPPCVSIFMPTHRAGREVLQDPIRFKGLVRDAEHQLKEQGTEKRVIWDVLAPAEALLENDGFWQYSNQGLAMFLSPGHSRLFRLPIEVDDVAFVNERFYIKPILPLLSGMHFYVLALSQGGSRLLECNAHRCRQVDLPADVALSLDDAIQGEDEHQTHVMRHGGDASNVLSGGGAWHGQGQEIQQKAREDMMFYLRQLDDGVRRTLNDPEDAVVLAGADSVVPFFRKISALKRLLPVEISGNPEHIADDVLAQKGRDLLRPMLREELVRDKERFGTAMAQHLASADADEVLSALRQGRVDTLFVPVETREVTDVPSDDVSLGTLMDLVDEAVYHALETSARIVPVAREDMPGDADLSAIFRYAATQSQVS